MRNGLVAIKWIETRLGLLTMATLVLNLCKSSICVCVCVSALSTNRFNSSMPHFYLNNNQSPAHSMYART